MTRMSVIVGLEEPLARFGLRVACSEAGFDVAAEAGRRDALLTVCANRTAAVVLTDLRTIGPEPHGTVHALSGRHRVLLLEDEGVDRPRALRAGASGFVARAIRGQQLATALGRAAAGLLVLDAPAGECPALTPRELDVLRLVAAGDSTDEIARTLNVSAPTIKTHLRGVNEKLGTRTRAAAACRATSLGLLN